VFSLPVRCVLASIWLGWCGIFTVSRVLVRLAVRGSCNCINPRIGFYGFGFSATGVVISGELLELGGGGGGALTDLAVGIFSSSPLKSKDAP
jgi:hypothetical protein